MSIAPPNTASIKHWLEKLQSIQVGTDPRQRIKKKDLVRILSSLATLVNNGVSLPQALDAILADASFRKYHHILHSLMETLRAGGALSTAMRKFPATFPELLVHQVQVGERAGNLNRTLRRIAEQLEHAAKVRTFLIKKLSYPALLVVAGIGSVTFMLSCVIPTFQEMYQENGAVLPGITQWLINVSQVTRDYALLLTVGLVGGVISTLALWKHPTSRLFLDQRLLRVPVIGNWLRNLAMLQFMETLANLLQSGFTLVEAMGPAAQSVNNRFVRQRLTVIHGSIRQGLKFSQAIQHHENLFPPIVKQLVLVGERTGQLPDVAEQVRVHLRDDMEKTTSALLGAIEPVLTAGLAVAVGGILLAVYLPMFDMIGNVQQGQ
ncbi:MAG: general secretion pathway protein GspF [Pirellulaceae bacterium]|nr:MAG: general secretion pathway protein GspF [Pirellulaceae bacterium]